ncbi:MAG: VCBS repeat-containing protein [Pyrinomonadaceae bacterium]|nr:VCBS repeat-containing protein [Pyrinomonadaceae bacterium]
MVFSELRASTRTAAFSAAAVAIAAAFLFIGGTAETTAEAASVDNTAPAATFPANGGTLGLIPDAAAACGTNGSPRDVTFTVSGLSGAPTNVSVDMTFGAPVHTWRGDITATLIAPNGASHVIFGKTGSTTATGCGNGNDLAGPYTFNDAAAATNWWTIAGSPTPTGSYRTTSLGGVAGAGTATVMNPAFAGVANPNGTWTLRFTDAGAGDTGAVSAANLTIDAATAVAADAPVDFNGDGKSDYVVVRNVGGGGNGQVRWFYNLNGVGGTVGFDWGLASDFFMSEDFDGDGKDDISIWRPAAGTDSAFYIFNSGTSTVRVETFGITGDNPTVVGDYNGDGSADLAVYRGGATTGAQSTWFYRTSPGGPITFQPWGINGDFPAPGDYDGDGKNDFVVQRGGSPQATFWTRLATGATSTLNFGLSTDLIIPGDYDGDGKTDITVGRSIGGQYVWFVRSSSTGDVSQNTFGSSATDFIAQGDYTGDGKTDYAVWRNGVFWVQDSASLAVSTFQLGSTGDYPVANYNTH